MTEHDPQHVGSESVVQKRRRESRSLGWLIFRDQDVRLLVGLPVTAILGVVLVVAGIVETEAWMIVVGAIYLVVSIGGLVAVLKRGR